MPADTPSCPRELTLQRSPVNHGAIHVLVWHKQLAFWRFRLLQTSLDVEDPDQSNNEPLGQLGVAVPCRIASGLRCKTLHSKLLRNFSKA